MFEMWDREMQRNRVPLLFFLYFKKSAGLSYKNKVINLFKRVLTFLSMILRCYFLYLLLSINELEKFNKKLQCFVVINLRAAGLNCKQ